MKKNTWLRVLLLLIATLTAASQLAAQGTWSKKFVPGDRGGVAMVFDSATNSTVLFGGYDPANGLNLGDTWVLGPNGWSQAIPATSPSARSGASMAYDPKTKTVVLFGGTSSPGNNLNDTWLWNGTSWTQVFPRVSPSTRTWYTQGMACHKPTGKVLLFGGVSSTGGFLADTWVWDGPKQTWTQLNPSTSPPARRASMTYDNATKTVVLFGGEGGYGGPLYGDTWEWDGKTWRQLSPSNSPPPRSMASLAYSPHTKHLVLFGGSGAGSQPPYYNDTWVWDGTTWTQLNNQLAPNARYAFGMDFDATVKGVVIYGGLFYYDSQALGDTWVLSGD